MRGGGKGEREEGNEREAQKGTRSDAKKPRKEEERKKTCQRTSVDMISEWLIL